MTRIELVAIFFSLLSSLIGISNASAQSDTVAIPATEPTETRNEQLTEVSVEFLTAAAGAKVIRGPADDLFFTKLQLREASAMTGTETKAMSVEACQQFAGDFFQKAVLDFKDEETDAIKKHLDLIVKKFSDTYPALIHRDWRFIKIRRDLCGGFSFTRGDCIVLSESTLTRLELAIEASTANSAATHGGESLLLHEQMHVLQRQLPELFQPLYEDVFRFRKTKVNMHPWIDQRQVTNPDGVSDDWIVVLGGSENDDPRITKPNATAQAYWLGTILLGDKSVYRMGRDFTSVAVSMQPTEDKSAYSMVLDSNSVPQYSPLEDLAAFTSRLPIRGGYDHPNEVAAYLFTVITHGNIGPEPRGQAAEVLQQATTWFEANLGVDSSVNPTANKRSSINELETEDEAK